MADAFFARGKNGVRVRIRLIPAGRAMQVGGLMKNVQGETVLKATVTTAPEGGKANQALIKMLSKEWKLAKSTFEVLQGHTSRNKVLLLTGDADLVAKILQTWAMHKGINT